MFYWSPTRRPVWAAAALACLLVIVTGCGLSGTKDLAEQDELDASLAALTPTRGAAGEAQTQDVPLAADNPVTQPALGRSIGESVTEVPPVPLQYPLPASTSAHLLKPLETAAELPLPQIMPSHSLAEVELAASPLFSTPAASSEPASSPNPPPAQPPVVAARTLNDAPAGQPVRAVPVARHVPTVEEVEGSEFQNVVLQSESLVIVDFYADWCGPCKKLAPLLDEVARNRPDIRVVKVNIDEQRALARQYQVRSVPTVIVFQDGSPIGQHTGLPQIQRALGAH